MICFCFESVCLSLRETRPDHSAQIEVGPLFHHPALASAMFRREVHQLHVRPKVLIQNQFHCVPRDWLFSRVIVGGMTAAYRSGHGGHQPTCPKRFLEDSDSYDWECPMRKWNGKAARAGNLICLICYEPGWEFRMPRPFPAIGTCTQCGWEFCTAHAGRRAGRCVQCYPQLPYLQTFANAKDKEVLRVNDHVTTSKDIPFIGNWTYIVHIEGCIATIRGDHGELEVPLHSLTRLPWIHSAELP